MITILCPAKKIKIIQYETCVSIAFLLESTGTDRCFLSSIKFKILRISQEGFFKFRFIKVLSKKTQDHNLVPRIFHEAQQDTKNDR